MVAGFAAVTPTALTAQELTVEEARELTDEFEAQDGFFWQRYFYRIGRENELDNGERFYQPSTIINGGIGAPIPRSDPQERTISLAAWERVSDYAMTRNTQVLMVMRGGKIEYEAHADGVYNGDFISGRSLSKSIIGLLAVAALEDGHLQSLDQTMGEFFAAWRDDPRGEITLRQLLDGTSGLEIAKVDLSNPYAKTNKLTDGSDAFAAALDFDLEFAPGSTFRFNHVDSQLAVMMIEAAVGQPYQTYFSDRLWRPLDAGPATVNVDASQRARAFCCIRTAPEAWLKIGEMINNEGALNGQQILSPRSIAELSQGSQINPNYGLMLRRGWTAGEPRPPAMADGYNTPDSPYDAKVLKYVGGGAIVLWMIPSHDLAILRIGNGHPDWDFTVIPNTILEDLADPDCPEESK